MHVGFHVIGRTASFIAAVYVVFICTAISITNGSIVAVASTQHPEAFWPLPFQLCSQPNGHDPLHILCRNIFTCIRLLLVIFILYSVYGVLMLLARTTVAIVRTMSGGHSRVRAHSKRIYQTRTTHQCYSAGACVVPVLLDALGYSLLLPVVIVIYARAHLHKSLTSTRGPNDGPQYTYNLRHNNHHKSMMLLPRRCQRDCARVHRVHAQNKQHRIGISLSTRKCQRACGYWHKTTAAALSLCCVLRVGCVSALCVFVSNNMPAGRGVQRVTCVRRESASVMRLVDPTSFTSTAIGLCDCPVCPAPVVMLGWTFFVVVFGINACARTLARLMVIALVGERRTQGMLAQSAAAAAAAATTGSPCLMRKGLFIDYMYTKY